MYCCVCTPQSPEAETFEIAHDVEARTDAIIVEAANGFQEFYWPISCAFQSIARMFHTFDFPGSEQNQFAKFDNITWIEGKTRHRQ